MHDVKCSRCLEEKPIGLQLSELNHADPENWLKIALLHQQLVTIYGIRYSYKKDRIGDTVHDNYDFEAMNLHNDLFLEYRKKYVEYKLNKNNKE
jgi:hypothetical protein